MINAGLKKATKAKNRQLPGLKPKIISTPYFIINLSDNLFLTQAYLISGLKYQVIPSKKNLKLLAFGIFKLKKGVNKGEMAFI